MLLKKAHIRKQGSVQETEYVLFSDHLGRLTIFFSTTRLPNSELNPKWRDYCYLNL